MCLDVSIQRYNSILKQYFLMAKLIDTCQPEDKDFYQNITLEFAKKLREIKLELNSEGLYTCLGQIDNNQTLILTCTKNVPYS